MTHLLRTALISVSVLALPMGMANAQSTSEPVRPVASEAIMVERHAAWTELLQRYVVVADDA